MHRSRVAAFMIDCRADDLGPAAAFWSAALGRRVNECDPASDKYVGLEAPEGEIIVDLQRVDHESRIHLDIETDEVEAEVARLVALGAREVERVKTWVVMEAPTGHRFCVVKPQSKVLENRGKVWG